MIRLEKGLIRHLNREYGAYRLIKRGDVWCIAGPDEIAGAIVWGRNDNGGRWSAACLKKHLKMIEYVREI